MSLPFNPEMVFPKPGCNPYGSTQFFGAKLVNGVDWQAWWDAGQPEVYDWLNSQGPREWIRTIVVEDGRVVADNETPQTLAAVEFACNNLSLYGYKVVPQKVMN